MEKLGKKQLILNIKELYPYYNKLESLNIADLIKILDKNCNNIPILNERNSCYFDSLLVAIFHDNNEYIKKKFLDAEPIDYGNDKLLKLANEIKEELKSIYDIIQNIKNDKKKNYCKNLRKLFKKYSDIKSPKNKINWTTEQLESLDILNFLNTVFNIKIHNKINKKIFATKSKSKTIIFKNLKLIRDYNEKIDYTSIVPSEYLMNDEDVLIKTLYPIFVNDVNFSSDNLWKPNSKDSKETFSRKIEKFTYLSSKFLFIHINRNVWLDDIVNKLNTKVIPSLNIKMKENEDNIYLRSIIIHHGQYGGGHYTCLYECKGVWYEYDDISTKVKTIGTFKDVCDYNDGYYLENCTNLAYW